MDALPLLLAIGCLALGLIVGWALRGARAAADGSTLAARAATAEAAAAGLRDQVEQAAPAVPGAGRPDAGRSRRARGARAPRTGGAAGAGAGAGCSDHHAAQGGGSGARPAPAVRLARRASLRRTNETEESLRATTESLAGALRSGSTRGVWGETQLRRVVEAAGLTRYVDFETQTSISSDAGAGRPDMVIRLPGEKSLAVDAKVPLDAYLDASAIPLTAQGDELARRRSLIDKHVKAVRSHVDALAKKAYWAGLDSSPEFVICFIPSESLLAAALEADPSLLDYAFGKRVALASPVNLWAVLKTVALTWTQQDVSQEARRLFDLGNELYGRLSALASHADDLRRAIERTVDSYNRFVGSLESRVLVTARRFPGIDQTKLDALAEPAVIEATTRRLTAPELLETADDAPLSADVGEIRSRLEATGRPE
ncbi:DNA recombination protein RmuC [Microbacterium elymi]|uniref:DNA recombination protein RmuC n=1 Tax=Microbacterium elymi TaxID=2909587 RepID=UPI00338F9BA4